MVLIFLVIASTVVIQSALTASSPSSDWSDWIIVPSNKSFPEPYVLAISKRINLNSAPVKNHSIEKDTSEITISIKGLAEKLQTAVGFIKDLAATEGK